MKQTAVDILYKFLYEMESFEGFDPYSFNHEEVFAKAKAMEKDQIIEAVDVCLGTLELSEDKSRFTALSGEGFYKERYILKTI